MIQHGVHLRGQHHRPQRRRARVPKYEGAATAAATSSTSTSSTLTRPLHRTHGRLYARRPQPPAWLDEHISKLLKIDGFVGADRYAAATEGERESRALLTTARDPQNGKRGNSVGLHSLRCTG